MKYKPLMPLAAPSHLPVEDVRTLLAVSREIDALLEESLRRRENLTQTFRRSLGRICELLGADGVVVTTLNEELCEQTWSHGGFGGVSPGKLLVDHPEGVRRLSTGMFLSLPLDVAGVPVGHLGLLFARELPEDRLRLALQLLDVVAEELDSVLALVQTAAEKHQLILEVNRRLSNPVFEDGMDGAVLALAERLRLPGFLLVFRDALRPEVLRYRTYRFGHLEHESGSQGIEEVDALISAHGAELVSPGDRRLQQALTSSRCVEAVLITAAASSRPLGKILVWSDDDGFSAFALDLIRVLASTLSQRLMDHNRERIHLSQFFAPNVIDELLQDPDYGARYLSPRDEPVGILFADINGFTRLCEQVFQSPTRIGRFVDRWSAGVVEVLWKHGGTFDKIIGDCIVGLFGPPFFRTQPHERALATVRAALEIQAFTRALGEQLPETDAIRAALCSAGLGVAIGVNYAQTFCGRVGPNQDYSGFSTGMNQTARLQSLAGFGQTLVMAGVRTLLEQAAAPDLAGLRYGPLTETAVKNVTQPLRYHLLEPS